MQDGEILNAAYKYAQRNHLKVITCGVKRPFERNKRTIISIDNWLSYVLGAEAVFTNSYHGTLFSLYFRKPVWTNKKDSRMFSLLKFLELEDRFIEHDQNLTHEINYDLVHEKLAQFRQKGINFIRKIIS